MKIPYKTPRARAWRNAMVAGINAGIEQSLFSLRPGDNRWKGANDRSKDFFIFSFTVSDIPAVAAVSDAGYDEIFLHVVLWPKEGREHFVTLSNVDLYAGDLFAKGWLERRDGSYLQTPGSFGHSALACSFLRLDEAARLNIEPNGFSDSGKFRI